MTYTDRNWIDRPLGRPTTGWQRVIDRHPEVAEAARQAYVARRGGWARSDGQTPQDIEVVEAAAGEPRDNPLGPSWRTQILVGVDWLAARFPQHVEEAQAEDAADLERLRAAGYVGPGYEAP